MPSAKTNPLESEPAPEKSEAPTAPPPSGYTFNEPKPRAHSQVMRLYKTPFEPFAVVRLRFWSLRQVPRLLVPREDLRGLGCSLEERLVACHFDGSSSLAEVSRACGLDHSALCSVVGALADRLIVAVE